MVIDLRDIVSGDYVYSKYHGWEKVVSCFKSKNIFQAGNNVYRKRYSKRMIKEVFRSRHEYDKYQKYKEWKGLRDDN